MALRLAPFGFQDSVQPSICFGDDWRLLETARLPFVLAGGRLLDDQWRPFLCMGWDKQQP
jgi:hypothetical protein